MKYLIVIIFLLTGMVSLAQMKEGRIVYERTTKMNFRLPDLDPSIASQLPKSRVDQFELLFGKNLSLWQILPSALNDDNTTFQSGNMVIRMAGGSNAITFHDLEKETRTDQRDVFDRTFLITDSIRKLTWKLTDETKMYLNHTVRKAVAQRISNTSRMSMENGEMKRTTVQDTTEVIAWFTTDIPVPAGPEYQGQLPGMILELDIDGGRIIYKAIEISEKVNTKKIKAPKEGKKLTAAEFEKEREKMMEEMGKNFPGRIRVQQ